MCTLYKCLQTGKAFTLLGNDLTTKTNKSNVKRRYDIVLIKIKTYQDNLLSRGLIILQLPLVIHSKSPILRRHRQKDVFFEMQSLLI